MSIIPGLVVIYSQEEASGA